MAKVKTFSSQLEIFHVHEDLEALDKAVNDFIEQIENGTKVKMFPFKDKLTAEEMKALVPVIRAFGG